jgi:hypothetical protein
VGAIAGSLPCFVLVTCKSYLTPNRTAMHFFIAIRIRVSRITICSPFLCTTCIYLFPKINSPDQNLLHQQFHQLFQQLPGPGCSSSAYSNSSSFASSCACTYLIASAAPLAAAALQTAAVATWPAAGYIPHCFSSSPGCSSTANSSSSSLASSWVHTSLLQQLSWLQQHCKQQQ